MQGLECGPTHTEHFVSSCLHSGGRSVGVVHWECLEATCPITLPSPSPASQTPAQNFSCESTQFNPVNVQARKRKTGHANCRQRLERNSGPYLTPALCPQPPAPGQAAAPSQLKTEPSPQEEQGWGAGGQCCRLSGAFLIIIGSDHPGLRPGTSQGPEGMTLGGP